MGDETVKWDNPEFRPKVVPLSKAARDEQSRQMRHAMFGMSQAMPASLDGLNEPSAHLRADPHETERIAADVTAVVGARRRKQVLRVIAEAGERGSTDDETALRIWGRGNGPRVASRRDDLVKHGWVEAVFDEDGQVVTRQTLMGNPAIVWTLTQSGRENLHLVGEVDLPEDAPSENL